MKNINSPSRIIALLGLSVCVHGAVLWAISEKVSVSAFPQAPALMWSLGAESETPAAPTPEPVAVQMKEEAAPEKEEATSPAKFKKAETPKKAKKAIVASTLPEKEVATSTKTLGASEDLPKTTVAESAAPMPENLDPEVNLIPVKESIAGVAAATDGEESTEAGLEQKPQAAAPTSEIAQAETAMAAMGAAPDSSQVRSYQSLRQVAGNQPPQYPLQARRLGHQGKVDLRYFVMDNGSVKDVQIEHSSGSDLLDQEAIRAVSGYKFYPGQAGWTKHPVKFSLRGPQETIPARLRTSGSSLQN